MLKKGLKIIFLIGNTLNSKFKRHKKILRECSSNACPPHPSPDTTRDNYLSPETTSIKFVVYLSEIFYANKSMCVHIFLVFLSPFRNKHMLYILPFAFFTEQCILEFRLS